MLKSFRLQFTQDQLAVVFNLSELHKAHVLHHWHLVGIPMISQQVKYVVANTVANCHLCNYLFRNLYEIKEIGDKERTLFAAVTRKHQIETGHVIGGIGSMAAVTILRDTLLSTGLYVCLACEARVLGARYQRRMTRENVHTTQTTDTDVNTMVALLLLVTPAEVVTVVIPESEVIFAISMLDTSHGQMATHSAPRRSERVTRPPTKLLDAPDAYAGPISPLRNVACERKAVTAEMRNIVLRPNAKQMLLNQVSVSKTL